MSRYVTIECARHENEACQEKTLIAADELTSDGGGDPLLLPVLIAPDGWMDDPDGDGLICRRCATKDELNHLIDQREALERMAEDDRP